MTLHVWKTDVKHIRKCFYVLKVMLLCSSPVKNGQLITVCNLAGVCLYVVILLGFHSTLEVLILEHLFHWIYWYFLSSSLLSPNCFEISFLPISTCRLYSALYCKGSLNSSFVLVSVLGSFLSVTLSSLAIIFCGVSRHRCSSS